MKKIRLLLALVLTSVCSIQGMWARTAPVEPEAEIVDGGEYYLWNVDYENYVHYNASVSAYTIYPRDTHWHASKVIISRNENGYYTLKLSDSNRYFYRTSSYKIEAYPSSKSYFDIAEVNGGYTIQIQPESTYFKEDEYMGFASGSDYLRGDAKSNIVWKILPANEESLQYIVRLRLYNLLCEADEYEYSVDTYESIYENESSTLEELNTAVENIASGLSNSSFINASWTEYPIYIEGWSQYSSGGYIWARANNGEESSPCTAYVEVDKDATFMYQYYIGNNTPFGSSSQRSNGDMMVYLDGEKIQLIADYEANDLLNYYINLEKGKHTIQWVGINTRQDATWTCFTLRNIAVLNSPTISVSLKEAGSLGTEVLYNTDHIKNVRKLSVSGPMNSEDWEKIMMMPDLLSLDLTDAEITEIPKEQLSKTVHSNLGLFHEIKLPRTLKVIGDKAFYGTDIRSLEFPDSLTTIGTYAFAYSRLQYVNLPESLTSVGAYAFYYDKAIRTVFFPGSARVIPDYCFYRGANMIKFQVSMGLKEIGNSAFEGCSYMRSNGSILEGVNKIGNNAFYGCFSYTDKIPSSVTSIGNYAFYNTGLDTVQINEGVSLGTQVFRYCGALKYAELPTTMYNETEQLFANCENLRDVVFKSPTVMIAGKRNIFSGNTSSNITIHVPDYLVNGYKQDSYWYNYNIAGFNTADIKQWNIKRTVNLGYDGRFKGKPNITLDEWGTIKISGDTPMIIDTLYTCRDWYTGAGWSTMIQSSCDNVSIEGQYRHRVYSPSKRWVFVCLPFDTKVSDIKSEASYAVRYYDGARRATNGTGGNWKNYSREDTIPAGTGFILQTSKEASTWFYAMDNESKQKVFSTEEISTPLAANESEVVANKGWNLVGNPWMCYYNIHKLNFTGAITVWNGSGYSAYSIIDDDYAILPLQPFFVQCPDEISEISFPVDGRQLTSVIESQNGVKAQTPQVQTRWLIDVELSDGEQSDKTRFVLNEQASLDYEVTRDASKFFSMDETVPQIYTLEEEEALAINERPLSEGTVKLGIMVAKDGTYTLSSPRNQFASITLVDKENGVETDLSARTYTFSASAGTYNERFELHMSSGLTTTVQSIGVQNSKAVEIYNLSGQRISQPQKGVYIVNGKKVLK